MNKTSKKKRAAFAVSTAAATAAIPLSMGVLDWKILAGAAAAGLIGGALGVNVPAVIKGAVARTAKVK
jgi:uncharacterized membrane protein YfcA